MSFDDVQENMIIKVDSVKIIYNEKSPSFSFKLYQKWNQEIVKL